MIAARTIRARDMSLKPSGLSPPRAAADSVLRGARGDCVLSFSVDFLPILRRYRVEVPRRPRPHQIDKGAKRRRVFQWGQFFL